MGQSWAQEILLLDGNGWRNFSNRLKFRDNSPLPPETVRTRNEKSPPDFA